MQIIKSHLLKNSLDPDIQRLFSHRSLHESTFYHKNLGSHFLSEIEKIVDHKLKFKGQTHKQGLGHGHFIQPNPFTDKRKIITDTLRDEESDKYLSHIHTLALQGIWTHWISTVSPFDLSWKNIIYNIQPKILSFVLNSMINSLATPTCSKFGISVAMHPVTYATTVPVHYITSLSTVLILYLANVILGVTTLFFSHYNLYSLAK